MPPGAGLRYRSVNKLLAYIEQVKSHKRYKGKYHGENLQHLA